MHFAILIILSGTFMKRGEVQTQEVGYNMFVRKIRWKHKDAKQYLAQVKVESDILSLFSFLDLMNESISALSSSFCVSKNAGVSEKSIDREFRPASTLPKCWSPAFSNLMYLSRVPPIFQPALLQIDAIEGGKYTLKLRMWNYFSSLNATQLH